MVCGEEDTLCGMSVCIIIAIVTVSASEIFRGDGDDDDNGNEGDDDGGSDDGGDDIGYENGVGDGGND